MPKEATMQFPKPLRRVLAVVALALLSVTLVAAAAGAQGDDPRPSKHRTSERLVVRGDSTVTEDHCDANGCQLRLEGGEFRGTPVGTGKFSGEINLNFAEIFSNGEGGGCAPFQGRIELGSGTPNRLVLALWGDSCQDGLGDPTKSSFTGLSHFVVVKGTGSYSRASGSGIAVSLEDVADNDRMTLIGRITH
jgi:hypothetical protein